MVSVIVKKQFLADQDNSANNLLLSLFAAYEHGFSLAVLDCLIKVFKKVGDDRMSKYICYLLKWSVDYLDAAVTQQQDAIVVNKLLEFTEALYKQLDFFIDTDPQHIAEQVKEQETLKLTQVIAVLLDRLPGSGATEQTQILSNPLKKFGFQFIEQRRLGTKILTMLVRDHKAAKLVDKS